MFPLIAILKNAKCSRPLGSVRKSRKKRKERERREKKRKNKALCLVSPWVLARTSLRTRIVLPLSR